MANVHSEGLVWSTPVRGRARRAAAEAQLLQITVLWGGSVLAVRHLSPPRTFRVGGVAGGDFVLPPSLGTGDAQEIVEVTPEGVVALLESGERVPLELGGRASVACGALQFEIELLPGESQRFGGTAVDAGLLGYVAASALSALGFVLALSAFVPPLGLSDDEDLDRDRLAVLLQYLDARAERERLLENDGERAAGAVSAPSEGARGEPGELGKVHAPRQSARYASTAVRAERDLTRSEAHAEATTFGLIGLLASAAPLNPGTRWDRDGALEPLDTVAFGNLFGSEIGEAAGSGGLGPSGTGQGSGGPGAGIGLGDGGVCPPLGCSGGDGGGGFGTSRHLGSRGHATHTPRVRTPPAVVSGRLPAEVVQRVVRQNHGRFRQCYEGGLRKNPTLNGRVTARFVIDRAGSVSLAQNGGSDLPDSEVVACVVSTFYGLSFPAPSGGTVQVSYPIVFSAG